MATLGGGGGIEKKRTITIDPSMYSISKKSKRSARNSDKTTPTTLKQRPFIRPNTLKKKLLEKIKQHQQRKQYRENTTSPASISSVSESIPVTPESSNTSFANSFNNSLSYLQSLSNNRQTIKRKNNVKPVPESLQQQPVQVHQQSVPVQSPDLTAADVPVPAATATTVPELDPTEVNIDLPSAFIEAQPTPIISLNGEPEWGCLKNGIKPTLRTLNNTTLKAATSATFVDNSIYAHDNNNVNNNANNNANNEVHTATNDAIDTTYGTRKQRLDEYKRDHVQNIIKNQQPNVKIRETKQHIITKKYKLGKYVNKNGPVIGVLIKNRQTQYNIEKKRNEMKHIPLHTIKARLHKKNLLKVGSIAPPDVLRELYETAVFAGDIEYENEGTLLHNFLTSSDSLSSPENE
jgi:hypothetical protein